MGSRSYSVYTPRTYIGALLLNAFAAAFWGAVIGIGLYVAVGHFIEVPRDRLWLRPTWPWIWSLTAALFFVAGLPSSLRDTHRRRKDERRPNCPHCGGTGKLDPEA